MLEPVEILAPDTWEQALAAKAAQPDAVPIAGGTDVMVELNFDRARPRRSSTSRASPSCASWRASDGRAARRRRRHLHARSSTSSAIALPGLAHRRRAPSARRRSATAARSAATSAPRRRPATRSRRCSPPTPRSSWRRHAARAACPWPSSSPARSATCSRADELIAAVHVPAATGPQQFAKVGTRNAMVIAVCSFALASGRTRARSAPASARRGRRRCARPRPRLRRRRRSTRHGLWERRAARPTPRSRASASSSPPPRAPIDDVRGTAAYRRHALAVLARRTLTLGAGRSTRCA